ncbi:MAG: DUF4115 domain-containing protein [Syntrophales bacterium]|nr:DUF4115 domain-containing protein [Syntrophales bacterium]
MPERELNLKQGREEKGITLQEIHAESKIPIRLLKAIEELKFDELPEPPFTKNLIKSYCKYTGIEPAPILELYNQYLTLYRKEEKSKIENDHSYEEAKSSLSLWVMGTLVFVTLFSVVLFYIFTERTPQVPPASMVPSPQHLASTTNTSEPILEKKKDMKLRIDAHEPTWIRIKADDEPPTEVMLRPGEAIERTASISISLDIGNAGGVDVKFQDKSLGKLGKSGEVVRLKFP